MLSPPQMLRSAVAIVIFAALFLPLAHKLPYYPRGLEWIIASAYDKYDLAPSIHWPRLLKSAGAHFETLLHEPKSRQFFEGWYFKVVRRLVVPTHADRLRDTGADHIFDDMTALPGLLAAVKLA